MHSGVSPPPTKEHDTCSDHPPPTGSPPSRCLAALAAAAAGPRRDRRPDPRLRARPAPTGSTASSSPPATGPASAPTRCPAPWPRPAATPPTSSSGGPSAQDYLQTTLTSPGLHGAHQHGGPREPDRHPAAERAPGVRGRPHPLADRGQPEPGGPAGRLLLRRLLRLPPPARRRRRPLDQLRRVRHAGADPRGRPRLPGRPHRGGRPRQPAHRRGLGLPLRLHRVRPRGHQQHRHDRRRPGRAVRVRRRSRRPRRQGGRGVPQGQADPRRWPGGQRGRLRDRLRSRRRLHGLGGHGPERVRDRPAGPGLPGQRRSHPGGLPDLPAEDDRARRGRLLPAIRATPSTSG